MNKVNAHSTTPLLRLATAFLFLKVIATSAAAAAASTMHSNTLTARDEEDQQGASALLRGAGAAGLLCGVGVSVGGSVEWNTEKPPGGRRGVRRKSLRAAWGRRGLSGPRDAERARVGGVRLLACPKKGATEPSHVLSSIGPASVERAKTTRDHNKMALSRWVKPVLRRSRHVKA